MRKAVSIVALALVAALVLAASSLAAKKPNPMNGMRAGHVLRAHPNPMNGMRLRPFPHNFTAPRPHNF